MNSTLNIYKASAGSGKTFTLTVRYIWLMVRPGADNEYLHTLAVTFTNKATAEMKDRILEHLYGISHNIESSNDCMDAVMKVMTEHDEVMTQEQLRERCGQVLTRILHDYSRFRVETIDSFFQSVLRSLARELGLGANLQVELNDKDVISHAVDRLIDSLDGDGKKGLQKIVLSYVREQMEETGRWSIADNLKKFAKCIFGEDFQRRSPEEHKLLENESEVERFRRDMKQIEQENREQLETLCNDTLQAMEDTGVKQWLRYKTPFTFVNNVLAGLSPAITENLQNFINGDGTVLLTKENASNPSIMDKTERLSEIFKGFVETGMPMLQKINTAQMARRYTHQLQLLGRIWEEILVLNEEMESINLASTPTLLSRLVQNQDSPFVFEKIGTVLRNIMIDEFQDTSRQQWDNFRVLLFEDQSQGGEDLIVGDIKQSIYRWRGGDWSLLQNLGKNMQKWNPEIVPLDTNWRSERRIIELNNSFFKLAAKALDPKIDALYSDVEQQAKPGREMAGFYSIHLLKTSGKKKGEPSVGKDEIFSWRMEEMLNSIRALQHKSLPLSEMAILVRHNKEAESILKYIDENTTGDISIVSDEAYRLDSSTLVMTIISAIRMLTVSEEQDSVPRRQFLMYWLRGVQNSDITDEELLSRPSDELLPAELMECSRQLMELSLYEMVEEIYRILHLERIEGQEAYHFAFLDAVNDFLRNNQNDPISFLKAWDDNICSLCIPSGKTNGVRILSIHKSKGLEFHTVFIPFADWKLESDFGGDLLWCEAEGHPEYNTLGKLPIVKNSRMDCSYYSPQYRQEHLENRIDELNALYVAMTRPAHNLYMWSKCNADGKLNNTGELLCHILNPSKTFDGRYFSLEEGEPVVTVKKDEEKKNRMDPQHETLNVPMRTYSARLNFQQSNEAQEMLQGITQRQEGIIFHNIMSQISASADVQPILQRSRMQGILSEEQAQRLETHLQQITSNPTIAGWFSSDNHLFNECAILDPKAKRRNKRNQRPDRIVMNGNNITVIDYKFGEEHGGYQGQVHNYMWLLHNMYPGKHITGYLWYVNNETIEEVSL